MSLMLHVLLHPGVKRVIDAMETTKTVYFVNDGHCKVVVVIVVVSVVVVATVVVVVVVDKGV